MSWIEPEPRIVAELPVGRVRTNTINGESDREKKDKRKKAGKRRRQKRWYYSDSGKAWRKRYREKRRQWERDNALKLYENHKRWREENRERFNLYQRLYYHTNEKRREYLRIKSSEYRQRKRAQKIAATSFNNQ